MYLNERWLPVSFRDAEQFANVVCRSLKMGSSVLTFGSHSGGSSLQVLALRCSGDEEDVSECVFEFVLGRATFSSEYYLNKTGEYIAPPADLSITCEHVPLPVCSSCFTAKGMKRKECLNQFAQCPKGSVYAINDSNVVTCEECSAGFYADLLSNSCVECSPGFYSSSPTNVCTQCPAGSTTNSTGSKSPSECNLCEPGTAISSSPEDGNVRLVYGRTKHEGRVEIYNSDLDEWGSLTGYKGIWSDANSEVVCRQFGLGPLKSTSRVSKFGISSGNQYRGFICNGTEASLFDCECNDNNPFSVWNKGENFDDVGVVCSYDLPRCQVCSSGYAVGFGNTKCTSCKLGFETIGESESDHDSPDDCVTCRNGTFGTMIVRNISSSNQYLTDGKSAVTITFEDSTCDASNHFIPNSQSQLPLGECLLLSNDRYGIYSIASNQSPTQAPTQSPTYLPGRPTPLPTKQPTFIPSKSPTSLPSPSPTRSPTYLPNSPTPLPTRLPSCSPTLLPTFIPSMIPTYVPGRPTPLPTMQPSFNPTFIPTLSPTKTPTRSPTYLPNSPTPKPTAIPTTAPSIAPTYRQRYPTPRPTAVPSFNPTFRPSAAPSKVPTSSPTNVNLITCSFNGGYGCCDLCESKPCSITFSDDVNYIGIY